MDQFVDPETRKRVSTSMQVGVAFVQSVQPLPNNRKSVNSGGDDASKVETGKQSNEKGI